MNILNNLCEDIDKVSAIIQDLSAQKEKVYNAYMELKDLPSMETEFSTLGGLKNLLAEIAEANQVVTGIAVVLKEKERI